MKCAPSKTEGILPIPLALAIQKHAPHQRACASREEALLPPTNPHHASAEGL